MVPYVTVDTIHVLGVQLRVFGTLLTVSVITVFLIAVRRGRPFGFTREFIAKLTLLSALSAFAGAHLFNLLYHPDSIAAAFASPATLVTRYHGISSFGGFFGGLIAALILFRMSRLSLRDSLNLGDCFAFALPFGCMMGRAGCALIHDHPGVRSDSFFAVAYPGGTRLDLGLIEVLFLSGVAALFLVFKRYTWPAGFYPATFFMLYGPFRLWLDTLRVDAPRYFGWTVDTYAAVLAICIGLGSFAAMMRLLSNTSQEIHIVRPRSLISER